MSSSCLEPHKVPGAQQLLRRFSEVHCSGLKVLWFEQCSPDRWLERMVPGDGEAGPSSPSPALYKGKRTRLSGRGEQTPAEKSLDPPSHQEKDEQLWELPSYRMQLGKQTEMPDCCSRRWTVSSVRPWLWRPVRVSSLLREAGSRPKHREEEAKQTRDGSKFRQPKTPAFLAWRTGKGHLDKDRESSQVQKRTVLSLGRSAGLSTLGLNLASSEENKNTQQGLDGQFQEHTPVWNTCIPTSRVERVLTKGWHL